MSWGPTGVTGAAVEPNISCPADMTVSKAAEDFITIW